jgi:hypothetical protein
MSQTYPMDRVIRRVDDDSVPRAANEKLVIIEARKRVILPKKPFFTFGMEIRYFVVSTSNDPRNATQGEIAGYVLQNLEHNIPVSLAYEVRCRPGNEERVALTLFHETESPGEVLDRYITKWLAAYGESGIRDFVSRCLDDRPALENEIRERALVETGLDVKLRLSLDPERSLNPITVVKEHLRAVVSDYHDEEQDLGLRITLDVDERNKVNAILQYRRFPQLHDLVPREVLKHVRQNVSLQTFCTDLNSAAVRQVLARDLDAFLAPYGRKIGTIKLEAKPCSLQFYFQEQHPVKCNLHEYLEPVIIQNKVQMLLRDVAQYKAARSPDLKDWLQKNLDRFIPQLLFKARYIDVVLRFEAYEEAIKRQLSAEACAIGYHIEQLITVPDLEPIKWKEKFLIDVSDSFETRLPNFRVNVQFVVTARIPDLMKVETYLNRLQNVPELMSEAIPPVARQFLHSVEPERFYMRFNYSESPDEPTVEQELVNRITKSLVDGFGAEVIEVVVKVPETDITIRLNALQQTICPFVVEMQPLHASEVLVFRGNFRVEAVDANGWHKFQSSIAGVNEIKALLEEHILAELHALTPDAILYHDPLHRKQLEVQITGLATRFVREIYGLSISVMNVRRDPTPQELEANQVRLTRRGEALQVEVTQIRTWAAGKILASKDQLARLEGLVEQRKLLEGNAGVEAELATIDREIKETLEALTPERIPTIDEVDRLLLPSPPRTASLQDLARLSGIPEFVLPPMKPQIEGDVEK